MKRLIQWLAVVTVVTATGDWAAAAQEATRGATSEELEVHFDSLTVGELEFKDVWVHRQTNAVVLIRHSHGIHTIKLTDLPTAQLAELEKQMGDLAKLPEEPADWREHPIVHKLKSIFGGASGKNQIMLGCVAGLVALLVGIKLFGKKGAVGA